MIAYCSHRKLYNFTPSAITDDLSYLVADADGELVGVDFSFVGRHVSKLVVL
jgi:hypothetical protein